MAYKLQGSLLETPLGIVLLPAELWLTLYGRPPKRNSGTVAEAD
jgi:hypothetical protein